jgi:hypothetical protein
MDNIYQRAFGLCLEDEIPLRGDIFLLDVDMGYELLGPWDEEGERYPLCDPIFVFKLYGYNELVQNYEIDITDTLTAEENDQLQKLIHELANDQAAAYAEQREERRNDR